MLYAFSSRLNCERCPSVSALRWKVPENSRSRRRGSSIHCTSSMRLELSQARREKDGDPRIDCWFSTMGSCGTARLRFPGALLKPVLLPYPALRYILVGETSGDAAALPTHELFPNAAPGRARWSPALALPVPPVPVTLRFAAEPEPDEITPGSIPSSLLVLLALLDDGFALH